MKLSRDRMLANAAALRLLAKREQFSGRLQWLRGSVIRWQPAILVGTGLLGGYLVGQRHVTGLARSVVSVASLGFALMRTPLGPLAVAMFRSVRDESARQRVNIKR